MRVHPPLIAAVLFAANALTIAVPEACVEEMIVQAGRLALPPRGIELLRLGPSGLGPNCNNAALLLHYPEMDRRHVCHQEMRYYLRRDFAPVGRIALDDPRAIATLERGDVLLFSNGDHSAYFAGANWIFDVYGYEAQYPYRVTPLNQAHLGFRPPAHYRPEDRMGFREAAPFDHAHAFRKLQTAASNRADTTAILEEELISAAVPILRSVLNSGGVLDEAVYGTIGDALKRASTAIEAWEAYGSYRAEEYFYLSSLYDWYDAQIRHTYFSSPYTTEDSFRRNNRERLTPSLEHRDLRVLAEILAKHLPSEGTVEQRIDRVRQRYLAAPRLHLSLISGD